MEPAHRPWPHSRRLQGLHARPLVLHPGQSWWRGPAFARRSSFLRCEDSTTTTLKRFLALHRVPCYFCNFHSHKCLLGVGRRGSMTGDLGDKHLLVLDIALSHHTATDTSSKGRPWTTSVCTGARSPACAAAMASRSICCSSSARLASSAIASGTGGKGGVLTAVFCTHCRQTVCGVSLPVRPPLLLLAFRVGTKYHPQACGHLRRGRSPPQFLSTCPSVLLGSRSVAARAVVAAA